MSVHRGFKEKHRRREEKLVEMAAHWSELNGVPFKEMSQQSRMMAHWECPAGHKWREKIASVRSNPKLICHECRKELKEKSGNG